MDRLKWWRKVTAVSNPTAAAIVSIGASYSDAVDRMVAAQRRRERLLGLIPAVRRSASSLPGRWLW